MGAFPEEPCWAAEDECVILIWTAVETCSRVGVSAVSLQLSSPIVQTRWVQISVCSIIFILQHCTVVTFQKQTQVETKQGGHTCICISVFSNNMVCFWESFQNLFFFVCVCVKSLCLDESRCRTVTQENSDPTVLRAAFLLLLLLHMKRVCVCVWVRLHSHKCIILYLESLRHSYEVVFVLWWGKRNNLGFPWVCVVLC